jgi:hypothetical protein
VAFGHSAQIYDFYTRALVGGQCLSKYVFYQDIESLYRRKAERGVHAGGRQFVH